jgi:hypothetical protein
MSMLNEGRRFAAVLLLSLFSIGSTFMPNRTATAAAASAESFTHAVSVCRFFHGGRASQRANLRTGDAGMHRCLRQRGWWADGNRTLDGRSATDR